MLNGKGGILMSKIITIGRQYGSGGREIGKKLAENMGIPFYDNELITIASKESGMSQELFENIDETATSSLLYSLAIGAHMMGSRVSTINDMPIQDKLFLIQSNVIKKVAKEGSCVIVGRCADYILKDNPGCIKIFIHADLEFRKNRAVKEYGEDSKHIDEMIRKIDKRRANYYNFYSGQKWGEVQNYDLSVNSGSIGLDNTVKLIEAFANMETQK